MDFFSKSLFNKLVISMTGALVLSLTLVTLFNNVLLQDLLDQRLSREELPSMLREIRNDIERELATPLAVSRTLANNPYILDWMRANEPDTGLDQVSRSLARIKSDFNASTTYVVSSLSNTYYHEQGVLKKLSPQEPRDQWFYAFLNSGKPYSIDIDFDEATRKATVFINFLVSLDGKRVGVAGMGRSLDAMTDLVRNYKLGETGFVFLVDQDGFIKLHPDQTLAGKSALRDLPGMKDVAAEIQGGTDFTLTSTRIKDVDTLLASLPIPSLGWHVVAQMPKAELYAGLRSATLKTSLASSELPSRPCLFS